MENLFLTSYQYPAQQVLAWPDRRSLAVKPPEASEFALQRMKAKKRKKKRGVRMEGWTRLTATWVNDESSLKKSRAR